MYSKRSLAPKKIGAEPEWDTAGGVASAVQYTPPVYRETKGCSYVEFYAFDPNECRLRRKRIKTNRIKGVSKRRKYVREMITRITNQLSHGWNPWIAKDTSELYEMKEALEWYENHVEKMLASMFYNIKKPRWTGGVI